MSAPNIIRVGLANIGPDEFAKLAQEALLAGSVHASVGFGSWGVEPGIVAEFGGANVADVLGFVRELLNARGESAAYFTVADANGTSASLLYADGKVEPL